MALGHVQGDVERGGNTVTTDNRTSTTLVEVSYPSATIDVFNAGTGTHSTIFSDSIGTPLSNPFTADTDGHWQFWAASGFYDVQFSGGGIPTPFTRFSFSASVGPELADPGSNGVVVRTSVGTTTARTITGTANQITVTNGDGVAGNPTLSFPSAITLTGITLTNGTFTTPTINTPTITGGTHTAITSLGIRSAGAGAFDLTVNNTETLTAGRTLTVTLNDANRTLNLGGNLTTASSFTTSGANALTLTTTAPTNVTLPASGTLATLAGVETLSNKTLVTPKVGTASTADFFDNNGVTILRFQGVASAVNFPLLNSSISGQPVLINVGGSDSNIQLNLSAKGTGNIVLQTNSGNDSRVVVTTTPEIYIGNGITNASPQGIVLLGTGGSGTNIAGANLDLTGGKGTGNAEPGQIAVRYPLRGASGTTLQNLSTDRFPITTCLYTNTTLGTAVTNTTTETSLFTGAVASAGSTKTLEGGVTKAGTLYRIRVEGDLLTTGTPTLQFKLKLGSTVINDSQALTMPNNNSGRFELVYYLQFTAIGATSTNRCSLRGEITSIANGIVTVTDIMRIDAILVDLTVNQVFDLTATWGTASPSNSVFLSVATIERLR